MTSPNKKAIARKARVELMRLGFDDRVRPDYWEQVEKVILFAIDKATDQATELERNRWAQVHRDYIKCIESRAAQLYSLTLTRTPKEQDEIESGVHAAAQPQEVSKPCPTCGRTYPHWDCTVALVPAQPQDDPLVSVAHEKVVDLICEGDAVAKSTLPICERCGHVKDHEACNGRIE